MSTQTVADKLSQLVATCAQTEQGGSILAMYDHVVQFTLLDGDLFHFFAEGDERKVVMGEMPARSLVKGYEIKGDSDEFLAWFNGEERFSDLVEHGRMFPVASHTTKRHIDYWLAQIVRIGNGIKSPKELY